VSKGRHGCPVAGQISVRGEKSEDVGEEQKARERERWDAGVKEMGKVKLG
jgi:hypothetical protein